MKLFNIQGWTGLLAGVAMTSLCANSALGAFAEPPSAIASGVAEETSGPILAGAEKINGILVLASQKDINVEGVTGIRGVVVKGPEFLKTAEFQKLLQPYLGQTLDMPTLESLQVDVIKFCRNKGHLVVDVFLRNQEVLEGTIQVAVIEGKIGKITVDNEGKKWFSDKLIVRDLTLKPGQPITAGRLNKDLSWLNRNSYESIGAFSDSFREVTPTVSQGGLGETDLKLKVRDRSPFRAFLGYEDSGIEEVGKNRFFVGGNWANAWGIDHRINYQFTTDSEFDRFYAHSASYVAPLPWKHELLIFGAYAHVNPDYTARGDNSLAGFSSEGELIQGSARYTIPLPQTRSFDHEVSVGLDFKRTDAPVLFGGSPLPSSANLIEVFQATLDYRARLKDKWGRTGLLLQGFYSPGDVTSENTDQAFNEVTSGAKADYWYARAEIQRETYLPYDFTLLARAAGQFTDQTLVPSETFGLGGYSTIRGYDERTVNGDYGWLVSLELRTPRLMLGRILPNSHHEDWLQFLVFYDVGEGYVHEPPAQAIPKHLQLMSVGAGLRYQMAENFRVRFDYGFQLDRDYLDVEGMPHQPDGRIHIGVELSF
jgi:hemolysin activation/secretion protein